LTTSEIGKPGASCVVPTLGVVVAVLTDEYWYPDTWVPVLIPVGYPGFQIPGSPSTSAERHCTTDHWHATS